jgi:CRISPR-associated protein Csd2
MSMSEKAIKNRYEFVYLFDVENGNPNGDPDAGNMPRIDPETNYGIVTDVCLKRKIRNYVVLKHNYDPPNNIYIREKAVLGQEHIKAFQTLGIKLGQETRKVIDEKTVHMLEELGLPEGLTLETDDQDQNILVAAMDLDKNQINEWLKDIKASREMSKIIKALLKDVKARKPKAEEVEQGRKWMCNNYFDIRTFGAVMSLKSAPNCGQVTGPVQLTFSRSIEPITPLELSITRMAVATEAEAAKQSGDNRTMGRKHIVPYGLYRAEGYISANFAKRTEFSEEDLLLLWKALCGRSNEKDPVETSMFDHDHSAARGKMSARKLLVFKHVGTDVNTEQRIQQATMGCAPAHKLFELIKVKRNAGSDTPARAYTDYAVTPIEEIKKGLPKGVEVIEML